MSEWTEVRLGEVIDEIAMGPFGSNIKVECFVGDGIPVLNGSNLQGFRLNEAKFNYVTHQKAESLGRANASRGDVVITHRGTLGQIVFIPEDSKYDRYVISQSQFRVRFNDGVVPEYIVYYFHSKVGQNILLSNASQVGVPAIARPSTSFKELKVKLPPRHIQKKIADILSSLDEKIETNRRINARLEELAQGLFRSWFIDFEPFGGEMPEEWSYVDLFSVSNIFDNKRIPLSNMEREKMERRIYPYLGATSVIDYVENYNFEGIYLLMGEDGSVVTEKGTPYLQYVWGKFWPNNHTHVLQGKNGYTTETLYCALSQYKISSLVTGAVQAKLSQQNMKKIRLPKPSDSIMDKFSAAISPIFERKRELREESRRLEELRDTLLPKLMSGEIKVG